MSRRDTTSDSAARELLDRLSFERLLADLTAGFADVSPDGVLAEIDRALQGLVLFFGYDRCTYGELTADGSLNVIASAALGRIGPHPLGKLDEDRTWYLGELRAGRIVNLPSLPNGLPPEARTEAAHVERVGLRSHLSIPLRARGRTTGVLAFAGFSEAREWPEEVVVRLTIIGEVFTSALARARSEDEARRLRSRLSHADRVARVSALAAAIAHEINQPLTAILNNAQAGLVQLRSGSVRTEDMREILEAVVRDDKRAAETIRTMRAFLRNDESGRTRIDLGAALHEVLGLLAHELGHRGMRIATSLEAGCWVSADRTQIEQVMLNLVLNGADAMEGCAPADRVLQVFLQRPGGGVAAVEVCDAGAGIAPQDLEAVFEPFWTTRPEGLGLGLAICRSIIEAHGGTIRAAPNDARGTTFRFELPLAPGDALEASAGARDDVAPRPALRPASGRSRRSARAAAVAAAAVASPRACSAAPSRHPPRASRPAMPRGRRRAR